MYNFKCFAANCYAKEGKQVSPHMAILINSAACNTVMKRILRLHPGAGEEYIMID